MPPILYGINVGVFRAIGDLNMARFFYFLLVHALLLWSQGLDIKFLLLSLVETIKTSPEDGKHPHRD